MNTKKEKRISRHRRVRAKAHGTALKPRLNVFRSLSHIYVQFIDDEQGKTLAAANSHEVKAKGAKAKVAAEVGNLGAERALKAGIKTVVFDRGGYQYHGR